MCPTAPTLGTWLPCYFQGNNPVGKKPIIGENYEAKTPKAPSIHAEVDAITKLLTQPTKLPKKVDLLVIRLSKTGVYGSSRPCFHCLKMLDGCKVKINFVYYSTAEGTIVRERFNQMMNSDLTYVSLGNRRRMDVDVTRIVGKEIVEKEIEITPIEPNEIKKKKPFYKRR